jgi:iron(III) transport system ATP-binding protein
VIELSRVSKWYGHNAALRNATVTINEGQTVLVRGPNGAGKSTMLRLIAGIEKADSGKLRISGMNPASATGFFKIKKDVGLGYLGSEPMLYADLKIGESIGLLAALRGVPPERVEYMIDLLQLSSLILEKTPRECSQGMLRKASIAQAVIAEPRLLLLDEPFSNLDTGSVGRVLELLRTMKGRGVTVMLASHQQFQNDFSFDLGIQLEKGRLEIE